MQPSEIVHHLAIRCTAAGAVLRDSDWNKVTCPDCHTKRRGRSKLNKIVLIISGVFLLFFVSCVGLIVGLSGNDPSPSPRAVAAPPVTQEQIHLATTSIKSYRMVQDAAVTQRGRQVSLVVVVGTATNEQHAREIGDNFVRMVKSFSDDTTPSKEIGPGVYDYLIGVYYPGQQQVVMGAKARNARNIRW